jgi:glycosyltransferase involved in cell wall biosynthesis
MSVPKSNSGDAARRRVLFIQATEPASYPPLIHASTLMAEANWNVVFLSAPIADKSLVLPSHPRITVRAMRTRPSHVMGKANYARYFKAAAWLSARFRPNVIYASDPLGAAPGLFAAQLARAVLIYHEHDSPSPGALPLWLVHMRKKAVQRARLVVLPNAERGRMLFRETNEPASKLRIVWNTPRKGELPPVKVHDDGRLKLYFHGSITPDRLPESVIEAVRRFKGRIRLQIAGYEAPGATGYLARLLALGAGEGCPPRVEYLGQIPRTELIRVASEAHVGLSIMPNRTDDLNMRHMVGASNKAFDYMAAGLALLVSDLPDWSKTFVPGFGRSCNPDDPDSIAAALSWFLDHPKERSATGARGRAKIAADWNYDTAFAPIIAELSDD